MALAQQESARRLRDESATSLGIREPTSYPLTLIPSFSAPITELPESRRQALRDYLETLISSAMVGRDVPTDDDQSKAPATQNESASAPSLPGVLDQACARCRGQCCSRGGDEAYLTEENIRRYLDAHPGARPADILAAYMDRVGQTTYQGSCIFHGPVGCTLSRGMRSDICNQHFCAELKAFQRGFGGARPTQGFFATEGDGATLLAAAFIDENGVREVPMPSNEDVDK